MKLTNEEKERLDCLMQGAEKAGEEWYQEMKRQASQKDLSTIKQYRLSILYLRKLEDLKREMEINISLGEIDGND